MFIENESSLCSEFLPMIESLFLPGKGSSESFEKGKKGKSKIIFRLIQVKSYTCMILTKESTDKQISFNIFFVKLCPSFVIDKERSRLIKIKKAENRLTAEWRLVSTIGAVRGVVTHSGEVDAQTVARTLPLPAWTSERWCGTILFITHVPAVIVPVTNPTA